MGIKMNISNFGNLNNVINSQLLKRNTVKDNKKLCAGASQQINNNFNLKLGGEVSRALKGGSNVTVYKADEYTSENPLLRVVTTQSNGQQFEQTIDPRKVDILNATEDEMLALNAYLVDRGSLDDSVYRTSILDANDEQSNFNHSDTRLDFISAVSEIMKMQYDTHNVAGYARYNKILNTYKSFMEISG